LFLEKVDIVIIIYGASGMFIITKLHVTGPYSVLFNPVYILYDPF